MISQNSLFMPEENGLTHFHTMLHFDILRYIAAENIVRKGEIACHKQFLLFSQCFLAYMAIIFHFKCTLKCCLQFFSIWTSLKFLLSGNGLRGRKYHKEGNSGC